MSAAVRFLAVAVAGWALVRGLSIGFLPDVGAFTFARAEAAKASEPPPIVPTEFPPIDPPAPALPAGYPAYGAMVPYGAYPPPPPPLRYAAVPVYYPAPASAPRPMAPPDQASWSLPPAGPEFDAPIAPIDQWPLAEIASPLPALGGVSPPAWSSAPTTQAGPAGRLDRLQLSAWALLRGRPGTGALASGGTLGGSQAGARLTYALDRRIAASLRSSSPVGGTAGGEVAAGIRLTPFPSIPVSLTAERRQSIGRYGTGRNAFALFVEGGVYQQPLGWNLLLDGYAQAGVVGARSRDLFADGGISVMRPLFGRFAVGAGAWGGYQPGLYRVDAGPRLSMRLRRNIRVDLDWRQRLAGTAEPASGPAVTLAADF